MTAKGEGSSFSECSWTSSQLFPSGHYFASSFSGCPISKVTGLIYRSDMNSSEYEDSENLFWIYEV